MALTLNISRSDDIVVVQCSGRIVFGDESDELRRAILNLLKQSKRIVLNLASIAYIDSSGLDTLVTSFISARNRKAEIKFAAPSPFVRQVLTSTNLDRLFTLYESPEEAVKAFVPHPEAAGES